MCAGVFVCVRQVNFCLYVYGVKVYPSALDKLLGKGNSPSVSSL